MFKLFKRTLTSISAFFTRGPLTDSFHQQRGEHRQLITEMKLKFGKILKKVDRGH